MLRFLLPSCLIAVGLVMPAQAAAAPTRLVITADEWSLTPAPRGLSAGPVAVRLRNTGQDSHDLALRRQDGSGRLAGATLRVSTTAPDRSRTRSLRLRRGTWRLWCTIPNHRQLGMRATLRVR